jgi:hypothetical protein
MGPKQRKIRAIRRPATHQLKFARDRIKEEPLFLLASLFMDWKCLVQGCSGFQWLKVFGGMPMNRLVRSFGHLEDGSKPSLNIHHGSSPRIRNLL